jgi:RNA polymerase sigma-70 factor (ECF subfamily)
MTSEITTYKSFEKLFKNYYSQLFLYAKNIVKSNEVAEDIVQDFFSALWIKKESVVIHSKIRSYFYQSIYNACINYISRNKKYINNLNLSEISNLPQEEIIEDLERNKIINNAVNNLPAQRRKIFKLICYDGLKYKEAAEVLGISINTIKTQMGRAFFDLRKSLGEILLYFLFFTRKIKKN